MLTNTQRFKLSCKTQDIAELANDADNGELLLPTITVSNSLTMSAALDSALCLQAQAFDAYHVNEEILSLINDLVSWLGGEAREIK